MFEHMPDYPMAVTAASGPDKTAVGLALQWLRSTTDDVGGRPLIIAPATAIREWPVLTKLGWAPFATWKSPVHADGAVLAVWPTVEDLARATDDRGTRALCVVPWNEAWVAAWIQAYNPVTLPPTLKLATEAEPEIITDPVVVEGLKALTSVLNVTILHVSSWQRGTAVAALRILHDNGHIFDAEAVRAWAMAHGWSARAAGQVAELAKQIAAGKKLRVVSFVSGTMPDAVTAATEAGRTWGHYLTERPPPYRWTDEEESVSELLRILGDIGFVPGLVQSGKHREIWLRHCPFREVAEAHRDVVCAVHLGLMQGALAEMRAPLTADRLEPFVEPSLCVARLGDPASRYPP
jgi:predicted hydrocarbon binding protein